MTLRFSRRSSWLLGLFALFALALTACGGTEAPAPESAVEPAAEPAAETLTVYSGRNEALIGPLLEKFTAATGTEVEVRYASTSELAATLLEEGSSTPADVYISQDAGALGALSKAGLLRALPQETLSRVPARFASPLGDWVGLSGRARAIVYNTDRISEDELPGSLSEVADPKFKGRFGVAPANASFQAHMAVVSAVEGEEALIALLEGLVANEAKQYPKNSAIVEATLRGEIDFGLTNHYYLWRALAETPDAPGANAFQSGDAASGFVNLAGAGVLSDHPAAVELVAYMLSDDAQSYFATETYEYPLVAGVAPAVELLPLDELSSPEVYYAAVSEALPGALVAINESGLLR